MVDATTQYSASALDLVLIIEKERAYFLFFKGQNYPMVDFLSEGKPALIPSFSFKSHRGGDSRYYYTSIPLALHEWISRVTELRYLSPYCCTNVTIFASPSKKPNNVQAKSKKIRITVTINANGNTNT